MSIIPSVDSNVFLSHEVHSDLEEQKSPIEEKTEAVSQPIFEAPSQPKGPTIFLKGPGLYDTMVGSGIPDGPSKGGNSGSSGFDGLRSPPNIGDKDSDKPSPPPQQLSPVQDPPKQNETSSEPTTQEVVDKGSNLLDKM